MRAELEITADGSHTLFVPALDEHYHSVNGAIQEAMHVFIQAGLHQCSKSDLHVFEVGFGTGLNAFLTLKDSLSSKKIIHYTTIEAYPIAEEIFHKLNFGKCVEEQSFLHKLHNAEWGREVEITANFYLKKIHADLRQMENLDLGIDVVYFDAFAPDKQADLWTVDVFRAICHNMNEGAVLVTYCAKGSVRRMMQEVGLSVERIPGPPGKREMLRATKMA